MNTEILHDTHVRSLAGTIRFPEVVGALIAEGVESYHADLVRREKTYYMPDGTTHMEKIDIAALEIAEEFSAPEVSAAIRDSQQEKIQYREVLDRVTRAGTTSYVAYLAGRRAIYFGRKGDLHIEEFPRP